MTTPSNCNIMRNMGKEPMDQFVFKKQDSLGANGAEDDKKFLANCFVDTGDYDLVKDFEDRHCLILGRTGAGKTALLTKLQEDKGDRVITLDPEALAMHHISNSTIIRHLNDLGIELDTFFKLLWRHAVCVEIFNHHFKATSKTDLEKLLEDLRYKFKKKSPHYLRALNYLEDWEKTFWKKTDSHVVEMITRTESQIDSSIAGGINNIGAQLKGTDKLSGEEKMEIKQLAQSIVDDVQMREVTDLLRMLNAVVEDRQKQYYIIIDNLDEKWVEDNLRYRLIKALIETVKDLNRLNNIKPLVVLRVDLLGHVFELTRDIGFQEEKYSSLYLHVRWTKRQLIELVDRRINYLLENRYRKNHEISHTDILPVSIKESLPIDYILEKTLMRPRDVIEFFNICIREAIDSPILTEEVIIDAERIYSRQRLDSLYYEWTADYPRIKEWLSLLRNGEVSFAVSSLDLTVLEERCLEYVANAPSSKALINDRLYTQAINVADGKLTPSDFRRSLVHILYTLGIIGIQLDDPGKPAWSYDAQKAISIDDIEPNTLAIVHPCFRSALNTSQPAVLQSGDLETATFRAKVPATDAII